MRELEVREAVRTGPLKRYLSDTRSRVIDELAICLGEARIDIAVVNGKLSGFELKSESDTLARLPKQAEMYDKVFDEVTLVLDPRHAEAASAIVPEHWGISEVCKAQRSKLPTIRNVRKAVGSGRQDPYCLAQLLWKSEAIEILTKRLGPVPVSKSRNWYWAMLSESMSLDSLKFEIREALKLRQDWR